VANNPALTDIERIGVVHSAGMSAQGHSHPQKHKFKVENTSVSGTVKVSAQGKANAHEWKYTADILNFTNCISPEPTTRADIELPD